MKALLVSVLTGITSASWAESPLTTTSTSMSRNWMRFMETVDVEYNAMGGYSSLREEEKEFEGKIDYDEAPKGRMLNDLRFMKSLNQDISLGAVGVWSLQPVDDEMKSVEPLDPYALMTFDDIVEIGNFAWSSDIRIGAPVSEESQGQKKLGTIGSEQEFEYSLGTSRWSMEVELYTQYNIHREENGYDDIEVRYEPAIMYQMGKKYYGRVSYESEMYHERRASLTFIDNREPVIQSGIGCQIHKDLHVYPFVDLPVNDFTIHHSLLGARLSWALI